MTELTEVRVPDIGDFSEIPVIEVLVEVGDRIRPEDPLVTLESDKATMDVPAPAGGVVRDVAVTAGDNVSEGSILLRMALDGGDGEAAGSEVSAPAGQDVEETEGEAQAGAGDFAAVAAPSGGMTHAASGGEAPGPGAETDAGPSADSSPDPASSAGKPGDGASVPDPRAPRGRPSPTASLATDPAPRALSHATPAMRRHARELGVDLAGVKGTGRKGRVLREDISGFVKNALSAPPAAGAQGSGIPPIPAVDFSKFRGNRDTRPLVPHQAHLGAAPAPLVGERPARHQPRRGRRDGPRSVPTGDQGRSGGRAECASPSSPS